MDTLSGDYTLVSHNFPLFEYQFHLEPVSVIYQFTTPSVDTSQTMSYNSTDNEHLFAVLFGIDRCWNAFSHLYSALREKGFPRDNIFVLFNNGDPQSLLRAGLAGRMASWVSYKSGFSGFTFPFFSY